MVLKDKDSALSQELLIYANIGSSFTEHIDFIQAANPHCHYEYCPCQLKTHDQTCKDETFVCQK